MRVREVWDVSEVSSRRRPDSSLAATVSVIAALLKLQGVLLHSHLEADYPPDLVCKISLPVGAKEEFEEMTGYRLTCIAEVRGQ